MIVSLLFLPLLLLSVQANEGLDAEDYYIYVLSTTKGKSFLCPLDAAFSSNGTCGSLSNLTSILPPATRHLRLTLIFMEGDHFFNEFIQLKEVLGVTLRPFSPSVQPTIICSNDKAGIDVIDSSRLDISGIVVTNCTSPFGFYSIGNLSIIDALIYDNRGIAVFVRNTETIVIQNSIFARNGRISNESCGHMVITSYQSHIKCIVKDSIYAGGIGYYSGLTFHISKTNGVSISLNNVSSTNNTSVGSRGSANINLYIIDSIIEAIQLVDVFSSEGVSVQDFDSQGGGLYLSLNRLTCNPQSEIVIKNSHFLHNYASTGGGAFLYFGGSKNCTIKVDNSSFFNNGHYMMFNGKLQVCSNGGGLVVEDYNNATNNSITINGSTFSGNGALVGGAFMHATAVDYKLTIINSTFENNLGFVGSAIVATFVSNPSITSNTELTDVSIIRNTRYSTDVMKLIMGPSFSYSRHIRHFNDINAAIIIASDRYSFTVNATNIIVRDNYNISGMALRGCNVRFKGRGNVFSNNSSPQIGGGLIILTTNNYFEVNTGSFLSFINNKAKYGGALYIADIGLDEYDISYIDSSYHYADDYYHCSFITDQEYDQLHNTSNQLVWFANNSASVAGDDAYGGMYRVCNIVPNSGTTLSRQLSCPMTRYWSLESNRSVSSLPFAVCACSEGIVNCSIRRVHRSLYPGQSFNLSLVTIGSCEGISPGAIVSDISGGSLSTSIGNQMTSSECKSFTYFTTSKGRGAVVTVSAARSQFDDADLAVDIEFLSCPIGFEQSLDNGTCVCNEIIENKVNCDINNEEYPFSRTGDSWIAYNKANRCFILQDNCPFDYCKSGMVSFSATNPQLQCALNRTGTLCGECQSGLSLVLGSNKCQRCTNVYLLLFPVFMISGVLLIAALIFFDITVASGRINGLLLYVNIVKMNESIFLPNGSMPVLRQFIAWLNLDLGIDTCFCNGLDAYWKTWIQFVFPFYLWILAFGMIMGCRHSVRFSRLCGQNAVPVLATLLLMSYNKIIFGIKDVLMYETLDCRNESGVATKWPVWSLDANISYFSSKRIPVLVFSGLLLLVALLYTLLLVSIQWLQQYSYKYRCSAKRDPLFRLKPFIDAYCGTYKDRFRYWTGLLLIIRLLLTCVFWFTSSIEKANSVALVIVVLVLLSIAVWTNGMYRERYLNVLEIGFIVKIGLISLGSLTTDKNGTVSILSNVSIGVAALILAFMMGVAVIKKTPLWVKCRRGLSISAEDVPLFGNESSNDDSRPGSPAFTIMRRESLIYDVDIKKPAE